MKILNLDRRNKIIKFIAHSLEDLWTIKSIISIGDCISGDSYRRQRQDQSTDSTRKPVFVNIEIEKFDFSSELTALRFTGVIKFSNPSNLAPIGEHHTLEIQLNEVYTIFKNELFDYQIELLKSSSKNSSNLLVVTLDNDYANIFLISNFDNKFIAKIESNRAGKRYNTIFDESNYFKKIFEIITKYNSQIIIAGPGHTKSRLHEYIKTKNSKLNVLDLKIQNIDSSALNELFTKKAVHKFFENSVLFKEQKLLNLFLENLGKNNGKAVYGIIDINKSIIQGACESILVSEKLWKTNIDDIQELIKNAEKIKANVHIVEEKSKKNIKTINSFGGIIANLRFKI